MENSLRSSRYRFWSVYRSTKIETIPNCDSGKDYHLHINHARIDKSEKQQVYQNQNKSKSLKITSINGQLVVGTVTCFYFSHGEDLTKNSTKISSLKIQCSSCLNDLLVRSFSNFILDVRSLICLPCYIIMRSRRTDQELEAWTFPFEN